MTDLLELAIKGHGGLRRSEQIEGFRVATSITSAIWMLKSQSGLLDDVMLAGETLAPRSRPDQPVWRTCKQGPGHRPGCSADAPRRCGRDRGHRARSTPWPGAQRYGQIRSRTS
jgi:hypothetical protein